MSRPRNDTPIKQPSEGTDTFTGFSDVLLNSAVFRTLTPDEWRIYTSLMIRHNGYNNGQIVLSTAQIVEETGICRQIVMPTLHRLEAMGLIVRHYMGHLLKTKNGKVKVGSAGLASEWEITDYHTWDKPMGTEDRKKIPASRTFADWCPTEKKIKPGSRSASLPQPGAGVTRSAPKTKPSTRVPSKPRPTRAATVKRPASLTSKEPPPGAPSRSQRSEPAIPEPTSPVPQRRPGQRTYGLDEILRDDANWFARHGTPRPPTQSKPDGKWYHLGKPITEAQADSLIMEEVPF